MAWGECDDASPLLVPLCWIFTRRERSLIARVASQGGCSRCHPWAQCATVSVSHVRNGLRHLWESRRFHPGKNDIRKSPRRILIFLNNVMNETIVAPVLVYNMARRIKKWRISRRTKGRDRSGDVFRSGKEGRVSRKYSCRDGRPRLWVGHSHQCAGERCEYFDSVRRGGRSWPLHLSLNERNAFFGSNNSRMFRSCQRLELIGRVLVGDV